MVQVVVHRVVTLDVVRVHVASDVLIPTTDALFQGPHGDGVACLLRQVLKREADTRPCAILRHTPHHVLAQLVVAVQEDVDLHRQQRLWRNGLRALDALLLHVSLHQLLAVGILKHLLHQILLVPEHRLHQRLTHGGSHRQPRLHAILCQAGEDGMVALVLVCDALRIVIRLREAELVNGVHALVAIVTLRLLQSRTLVGDRFRRLLRLRIDGRRHRVVHQSRVGAHVTDALSGGLELFDCHPQLTIIDQSRPLVQILMEEGYFCITLWESAPARKQFALTHDLHRLPVSPHKRHQRLRHLGSPFPHGISLIVTRQVVHLQQHQSCVASGDALAITMLLLQRKADARQVLGPVHVTSECSLVVAIGKRHQREDAAEFAHLLLKRSVTDKICHFLQLHEPQGFLVPIILDKCCSCFHNLSGLQIWCKDTKF